MSRIKFTAPRIDRAICDEGKHQTFIWDTEAPGLGLRITRAGAKAYIFQSRVDGRTLRPTIGDPKVWTLSAAQAEARRLQMLCDQGKDPRQVKSEEISANRTREATSLAIDARESKLKTLGARSAWTAYLNAPHPKWSDVHRQDHFNASQTGGNLPKRGTKLTVAGPLASLLEKPLATISAQTVTDWIVEESNARPTATLNAYRKFRAFIRWCIETPEYRDFVQHDCYSTRGVTDTLPSKRTKENDCLQREQLRTWFEAVRNINNPVIAAYLQALLLTGARRQELAELKWAEVDFQWNSFTIKDKVEQFRTVPLTPCVAALLDSLPRRNQYVFSSLSSMSGRIVEPRKAHNGALAAADLPHLSLHGLRRSFGTLSEWVECPVGVVAQIMGHKPSAIAEKHYRRRPLDLLRMWHTKIESFILEQANVQAPGASLSLSEVA